MRTLLVAALSLLVAAPAFAAGEASKKQAEAPITNASEAAMLYRRLCVETMGNLDKTTASLSTFVDGGIAKKLAKDQSKQFTGHDSLATWIVISPRTQQKLMVDYDSKRTCAVYVNQASVSEIRAEFRKVVGFAASTLKGKVAMKSEQKDIGGKPIQLDFYEVIPPGAEARLAMMLSSSDKPVGDTQHYMTYAQLPAKAKKQ